MNGCAEGAAQAVTSYQPGARSLVPGTVPKAQRSIDGPLSNQHNAHRITLVARSGGNPFEFGQTIQPDVIVDREEEVRRLTGAARNGERLFLIGPRRYGKTSLLNLVQRELAKQQIVALKYDIEKYESTELLAKALLAGAIRALAGPVEKLSAATSQQIKRFFGALEPEMTTCVLAVPSVMLSRRAMSLLLRPSGESGHRR